MLASVLRSERAIRYNIQIVRIFIKMREMLSSNKEVLSRLDKMEHALTENDNHIRTVFDYIKMLEQVRKQEVEQKNRKRVGFKREDES